MLLFARPVAFVHHWCVLRGGSWATSNRTELQSSYRNVAARNDRDVIYGFRRVLAPEDKVDNR
jgi:formylglycine-generating enzyme required for sulfatase activity